MVKQFPLQRTLLKHSEQNIFKVICNSGTLPNLKLFSIFSSKHPLLKYIYRQNKGNTKKDDKEIFTVMSNLAVIK